MLALGGLHHHANLRPIPAAENLSKRAKLDPDLVLDPVAQPLAFVEILMRVVREVPGGRSALLQALTSAREEIER